MPPATTKRCPKCREVKPLALFHKNQSLPLGVTVWCAACRRSAEKDRTARDPEHYLRERLKSVYGLSLERYNEMKVEQNGCCRICLTPISGKNCHVDHCHQTGKVRALLCGRCNPGIAMFDESPAILLRAVEYLREFNDQV